MLRAERLRAGLSQRELAQLCGVAQGSLSAYEQGSRTPSLATVECVLAGMGRQLKLETEPLADG